MGIDLAHCLLVHELIVIHCHSVMLNYGHHFVVLRFLRAVEGCYSLVDATFVVVLATIVTCATVLVEELAIAVITCQNCLERLINLLVLALFLPIEVLIATLSDQAAKLRQHILLINLFRVSNGAHGYDGLATAIGPVFIDG